MTRPEELFHGEPLRADDFDDGWSSTHCDALATMCNAYPLALALAEAVQQNAHLARARGMDQPAYLANALAAFLAHRQEATKCLSPTPRPPR